MSANDTIDPSRRDFLYIATGMAGVVGAGAFAWPFIDQMRPDASTLALSSIEVDVAAVQQGMSLTVKWRGKPVFIRNRTPEEVKAAQDVHARRSEGSDSSQRQPAGRRTGDRCRPRSRQGKENWIIMVGVCTHLGCVPLGQQGDFGGWFCPCHGSHYDTAGRIRKGPAPENLAVPTLAFISDTKIRIG